MLRYLVENMRGLILNRAVAVFYLSPIPQVDKRAHCHMWGELELHISCIMRAKTATYGLLHWLYWLVILSAFGVTKYFTKLLCGSNELPLWRGSSLVGLEPYGKFMVGSFNGYAGSLGATKYLVLVSSQELPICDIRAPVLAILATLNNEGKNSCCVCTIYRVKRAAFRE